MTGRVLVFNAGSSSLKYRLLEPVAGVVIANGIVERIGRPRADGLASRRGQDLVVGGSDPGLHGGP